MENKYQAKKYQKFNEEVKCNIKNIYCKIDIGHNIQQQRKKP